ncbi:MAG: hypothetical protein AAF416_21430 [Pseudomonadota bacterium]
MCLALPTTSMGQTGLVEREMRAERLGLSVLEVDELDAARAKKRDLQIELRSLDRHRAKMKQNRDDWAALARHAATDSTAGAAERRSAREVIVADYDAALARRNTERQRLIDRIHRIEETITEIVGRARLGLERPEESEGENEDAAPIGLAILSGYWREAESAQVVGLFADDLSGNSTNRLRLHTGKRVWTGSYEDRPANDAHRVQRSRIAFRYQPKASEMNPKLPAWVREAVEGRLEWRIALDEACCPYELIGTFNPGRVVYPPAGRDTALIEIKNGEGTPRPLRYRMAETPTARAPLPSGEIEILPVGNGLLANISRRTAAAGRAALIEEQAVHIRLMLNDRAYAEAGRPARLTATVTNRANGQSARLTMKRVAPALPGSVFFATEKPVSFGDDTDMSPGRDPAFMTNEWLMEAFGAAPGARIDLGIGRRGVLTVEAAGQSAEISVHDGVVQLMVEEALADLAAREANWAAAIESTDTDFDAWTKAHHQLRMAKNLRTVIANIRAALPGAGRMREGFELAVLQFYLGPSRIIEMSDDASSSLAEERHRVLNPAERPVNARMRATPHGKYLDGVSWVTSGERALADVIADYREASFDRIALSFAQNMSEAAYGAVTEGSPVRFDLIFAVATGTDLMGRKISDAEFRTMLVQEVFGHLAEGVKTVATRSARRGPPDEAQSGPSRRARAAAPERREAGGGHAAAAKRAAVRKAVLAAQPADRPASARAVETRIILPGESVGEDRRPKRAAADVTEGDLQEGSRYVPPYRFVEGGMGEGQCSKACAAYSPVMHVVETHFKRKLDPVSLNLLAVGHGITPRFGLSFDLAGDTVPFMQRLGFDDTKLEHGRFGVAYIQKRLSENYGVSVSVSGGALNNHVITVRKVLTDGAGTATGVQYLETSTRSGRAEVREMTQKNFMRWMNDRLAENPDKAPHTLLLFRSSKGGPGDAKIEGVQRILDMNLLNMPEDFARKLRAQGEGFERERARLAEAQAGRPERARQLREAQNRQRASTAHRQIVTAMRDIFGNEPPPPAMQPKVREALSFLRERGGDRRYQRYLDRQSADRRLLTAAAALNEVGVDLAETGIRDRLAKRLSLTPKQVMGRVFAATAPETGFYP